MGEVNRFFYPAVYRRHRRPNSPARNETDPPRRVGMNAGESVVQKMRNLQKGRLLND